MTSEEAIKILGYMCPTPTRGSAKSEMVAKQNEAVCIATLAISKNIPKKVHLTFNNYYCPNCYVGISRKNTQHFRYCSKCGQALDWRGVNNAEIH